MGPITTHLTHPPDMRASALITLILWGQCALAAPMLFFGQDLGTLSLGTPTAPNPTPNTNAARTSFLSALTGTPAYEDFESFVLTEGLPNSPHKFIPLSLKFGGPSEIAVLDGDPDTVVLTTVSGAGTDSDPNSSTTGKYVEWQPNSELDAPITVTFATPQTAFGFTGRDFSDEGGRIKLTFSNGLTFQEPGFPVNEIPSSDGTDQPSHGVLFFGIIDTANPFTSITFSKIDIASGGESGFDEFYGFDDFVIQETDTVVPEPSSLLMSLLVVIGAVIRCTKRL